MVTKTYSPIFLKFKIKFNLNHLYNSFLVNPSRKLSNEKLQKSVNDFWWDLLNDATGGKAPVRAVYIRIFLKENHLITVKKIFIIADPSN